MEPDPGPMGVHPPETGRAATNLSSASAHSSHFNPERLVQEFRATGNPFALISQRSHKTVSICPDRVPERLLNPVAPTRIRFVRILKAPENKH